VGIPHADLLGNPVAPDAAKAADERLAALLARFAAVEALTAAGAAPTQARAPKGSPGGIGGEWIDTPGGLLDIIRSQGGASLDPTTLTQPTDGYMVAVQGFNKEIPEDEFFGAGGEDALHAWMAENQAPLSEPGAHIGVWHDTANGEVVLDVSENVKDLDEAIRLGQDRNQQSIYDIVNGVEIDTGGTGDRQASGRLDGALGTGPTDDRSNTDGTDPDSAVWGPPERRSSRWVFRLAGRPPEGVRPSGDRRTPAPRLSALLHGVPPVKR
jgi:hypothetical protein